MMYRRHRSVSTAATAATAAMMVGKVSDGRRRLGVLLGQVVDGGDGHVTRDVLVGGSWRPQLPDRVCGRASGGVVEGRVEVGVVVLLRHVVDGGNDGRALRGHVLDGRRRGRVGRHVVHGRRRGAVHASVVNGRRDRSRLVGRVDRGRHLARQETLMGTG